MVSRSENDLQYRWYVFHIYTYTIIYIYIQAEVLQSGISGQNYSFAIAKRHLFGWEGVSESEGFNFSMQNIS